MKKNYKILIPFASLALLAALFPSFASTDFGTKTCLLFVNRFSSAKIMVSSLSLSWLKPQQIDDLEYEDINKGMTLRCKKIRLNMGLLKALAFSKDFNLLEITEPKLLVTSNFLSAPSIEITKRGASLVPSIGSIEIVKKKIRGYQGQIKIKEGSFEVGIQGNPNIILSPIGVEVTLKKKEGISSLILQIDSLREQSKGYLCFKGSLEENLFLEASSSNFPLEGADQFLKLLDPKYEGSLVAIAGPTLEMRGSIKKMSTDFDAKLTLHSQNIKAGFQMSSKENGADLNSPAFFQIALTPESNKKLSFLFPYIPEIAKKSSIVLLFNVESLHIPKEKSRFLIEKGSFLSFFSSSPYFLTPEITPAFKGKISSSQLKEKIIGELNLELEREKNFSGIIFLAEVKALFSNAPSMEVALSTQKIPTSLLDGLFSFTPSDFLGPWLEANGKLNGNLKTANLSLNLKTSLASLEEIFLTLENKKFTLLSPLKVTYQLEPALFEKLSSGRLLLKEPRFATVEISKASFTNNLFLQSKILIPSFSLVKPFSLKNYTVSALEIDTNIDTLANIHIQAKSDIFTLQSRLKLEEKKVALIEPLEIECKVKKEEGLLVNLPFTLLEDAKAKLTFNPIFFSLETDLKKSKLQAHLDIAPLTVKNKENGKEITLDKIDSDIYFSGLKEQIDCSFQLDLAEAGGQNNVQGSLSLQKILSYENLSFWNISLKTDRLFLPLLEDFYPPPLPLSPLIGDVVSCSFNIEKNPAFESFSLQAETPVLKIKGSLAREEDKFFFPKNSGSFEINYTLTPNAYKAFSPTSPFVLKENALFLTSITDLNIPYLPNSSLPDLANTKINAVTSNRKITFQKQGSSESITLSSSQISLEKKDSEKDLILNINTKAQSSSLEEGVLHLDLILSKFLNKEGSFALSDLCTTLKGEATKFPSTALDFAFGLKKEPFTLILGPSFESTLNLSLQNATGPLSFNLTSNKAHIDFTGKMERGTLKLTKDLQADLLLTQELGKFILEEIRVKSLKSFFAPAPISVFVSAKGFSFPIQSMDLSKIQAPFIRMNFGKLYCKNEGAMINLLRQLRSKESEGKEIQIWLAPTDLQIRSGLVDVERTEILLDKSYDIALWGQVDLPKNYIDMVLGLTGDALEEAFGITDLPKNYVIKIPIKGPLNDVKIKTGSATSKITALLLWKSNALDSVVPFGGILKKVVPPPGDGKAPPPKTPFPWQVGK